MANHRVVGGCCGGFPEPEFDKKSGKECCGSGDCVQCNSETGCGHGPVKERPVQDASGSSGLSQLYKSTFWLISTPAGGRYIVEGHDLDKAIKTSRGWADLFQVWARRVGESEVFTYHLPLNMSDISLYEPVSDIEPVGRATVEKKKSRFSGHSTLDPGGLFGW